MNKLSKMLNSYQRTMARLQKEYDGCAHSFEKFNEMRTAHEKNAHEFIVIAAKCFLSTNLNGDFNLDAVKNYCRRQKISVKLAGAINREASSIYCTE